VKKGRIDWEGEETFHGVAYEQKSKLSTRDKLVEVGDLERLSVITEKTIFRVGAVVGQSL